MKNLLLLIAAITMHYFSYAQLETPLYANADEASDPIKSDEEGKYYAVKDGYTVYLDDDGTTYKLMDKNEQVLEEGSYKMAGDGYNREGKWTTFHGSGKPKMTGYYKNGNAIGLWQQFSVSGQLQKQYNMALIENESTHSCMAGCYQEFFETGKLKLNGFYKAVIDKNIKDTVQVEDPITGERTIVLVSGNIPRPDKTGTWEYYNEAGEVIKTEEY